MGARVDQSSKSFPGALDEVRVYDRVLDVSEFNLLPGGGAAASGTALETSNVSLRPNPVRLAPARFVSSDLSVDFIFVEVYDLSGKRVFSSGWQSGSTLEWNLLNDEGEILANGVYLYVARTKRGDAIHVGEVEKMVILR
jgi:hypothetical protein